MTACRFVASTEPRVLPNRHVHGCTDDGCTGCLPCTEPHCVVCGRAHADGTCAECTSAARDDLLTIAELCNALPDEAEVKGVDSEAMMLLGPAADPEAWNFREASALAGRIPADWLAESRDEPHPMFVLGTWDMVWRDHLEHETAETATLPRLVDYLHTQLTYMAGQALVPFGDFARDLRRCRGHLEDVLLEGERDEKGAPCVQCGRNMTRVVTNQGAQDAYHCRYCHRTVSGDQYRYAVGVAYRAHASRLTAAELGERLGVKPSIIRVWGARGLIRKRGKNTGGITLYDVADAEQRHAGEESA